MIHDDPLLRTYRDAAELYLRVVDMPSELRERYLTTVCVGRDLLKFTVEELVRGDAADGSRPAGEDARCVSADRVTATLIRFTDALNTVAPAHPEVTAYVPGAYDSDRERTLAELVKLEQKSRWAARRPKPLEVYRVNGRSFEPPPPSPSSFGASASRAPSMARQRPTAN